MDTQILLVFIIGLLTINLLFVGVYIVLVLKEVRTSLFKFNEILETANQLTKSLAAPIITTAGTIETLLLGFKSVQTFKAKKLMEKGGQESG